jgi:hypothetical protein
MKTIAIIQFVIAATCAIVFVLPNLWIIGNAISEILAGNHSLIFLALLLVVVWWYGLWLLAGYLLIFCVARAFLLKPHFCIDSR